MKAYYYLTKPGIIYGNLIPTVGAFLLAAHWHIDFILLIATVVGLSLVIASACVCNNYLDRGLDAKMTRTRRRALVQGTVSTHTALLYSAALGIAGFLTLTFAVNILSAGVAFGGFVAYVALYGFAKRHSVHGTLVGSLAGAAPPVVGYTAITNHLDGAAAILFLTLACWQMPHFYTIALYRLQDYRAAGLPVLPAVRGIAATKRQIIAYIVAFILACSLLTFSGYTGYIYLAGILLMGGFWLQRGLRGLNRPDSSTVGWARQMFVLSLVILPVLSLLWSVGTMLP